MICWMCWRRENTQRSWLCWKKWETDFLTDFSVAYIQRGFVKWKLVGLCPVSGMQEDILNAINRLSRILVSGEIIALLAVSGGRGRGKGALMAGCSHCIMWIKMRALFSNWPKNGILKWLKNAPGVVSSVNIWHFLARVFYACFQPILLIHMHWLMLIRASSAVDGCAWAMYVSI